MLQKTEVCREDRILKTVLQATIHIIGSGGVGSWVLAGLAKGYRTRTSTRPRINIFERDRIESKNIKRQLFAEEDIGKSKASTLKDFFDKFINIIVFEEYIDEENIRHYMGDGDVIFLCVDNHKTRKIVSNYCESLNDIILISGGNETWDGNVQVYIKNDGKDITPPLTYGHPEIEDPQDEGPWSCAEQSEEDPQIIATNFMVAAWMLAAYWNVGQKDCEKWNEVIFDIQQGKAASFDFSKRYQEQTILAKEE